MWVRLEERTNRQQATQEDLLGSSQGLQRLVARVATNCLLAGARSSLTLFRRRFPQGPERHPASFQSRCVTLRSAGSSAARWMVLSLFLRATSDTPAASAISTCVTLIPGSRFSSGCSSMYAM